MAILMWLFITLLGVAGLDYCGVVGWGCYDFPSILLTMTGIVLDLVYFFDLKRTDKVAVLSERDEARYLEAKQEAMVRQVQPHFLFNSLTLVQNQYHKSMREGDDALRLVSESLAASIAASQKPLVPFEDEIATLRNYADLMNLRNDTKIPLIISAGFTEFEIPPLSLQTFIENAFKYAKLTEVPNGQITLSSRRDVNRVLIKISDNGVGFDTTGPDPKIHTGIENAKFRLSYTLGANVIIESEVNRGTDVIISVPLGSYGK
jgi:sensor histidine kinase YesM